MGVPGRPRFVVLESHLEAFAKARAATTTTPKPARRKKRTGMIDFFPD
jgi:hypothetical protein